MVVENVVPGFCKSKFMTREPGTPLILKVLEFLTAMTIQEGSKTLVEGRIWGDEAHGKFLNYQKIAT